MSFYRELSKEDRNKLRAILSEEKKSLLKRPQYIIGNIIIAVLIFYLLFKALGYKVSQFPNVRDTIPFIVGLAASLSVLWLLNKWFKVFKNIVVFLIFLSIWMFAWGLLRCTHSGPTTFKLEYLVYAIFILFGWLCSCGSIEEHLSEKIFMSQRKE